MPELPEVQTIASQLQKTIPGQTIRDVWSDWPKLLQVVEHKEHIKIAKNKKNIKRSEADKMLNRFKDDVVGKKVEKVERRGKNILIHLSEGHMMLAHQKMTGHFLLGKWEFVDKVPVSLLEGALRDKMNGYIHVIFYLSNGKMLALSDLRKFAKIVAGPKEKILGLPDIKDLGPEPLSKSFSFEDFKAALKGKKGSIKTILMKPEVIAGIGNIYSDEILWAAGVHPTKDPKKISDVKLRKMYDIMKEMLKFSISIGGDSMSDFRDVYGERGGYQEHHNVYRRTGEVCKKCKTEIRRIKVGGRSAHFCPKCQPNS